MNVQASHVSEDWPRTKREPIVRAPTMCVPVFCVKRALAELEGNQIVAAPIWRVCVCVCFSAKGALVELRGHQQDSIAEIRAEQTPLDIVVEVLSQQMHPSGLKGWFCPSIVAAVVDIVFGLPLSVSGQGYLARGERPASAPQKIEMCPGSAS